MILAALASLSIGERTVLRHAVAGALLVGGAPALLTQPKVEYVLVGHVGGKVAIIESTPSGPADAAKDGSFPGGQGTMPVRAALDPASALGLLRSGTVQAAFVPASEAPKDLPVLWRTRFLSPRLMQPAMILLVFGVAVLLLTFGAAQSGRHPLDIFAELYIDALRGIPMLVIILYVGFPLQGAIRDATGGVINMSRLTRGVVGIALGYAAYLAEIFRAGIEAIPHGKTEAALSLGLNGWQTARYVVLPRALRIVVPLSGNELIAMLKDTSLLSVLSVRDITRRAREFQAATFQVFPPSTRSRCCTSRSRWRPPASSSSWSAAPAGPADAAERPLALGGPPGMLGPMLEGPVATIDLGALEHNLGRLEARLRPGTLVLAAVKADAYGHGAVRVARRLERRGVSWFGVATPQEALELRAGGVSGGILLFGPIYRPETLRRLSDADVALTVADASGLEALRAARGSAPYRLHVKTDTGMGRLGRPWPEALDLCRAVERDPGLRLEGVWTHLARSDEPAEAATARQLERFEQLLEGLRRDGIEPPLRHAANSAAVFAFPEAHLDLVRPGIALYGYHSSDAIGALEPALRPVMRLQAPVTFVKRVRAGTPVSYGGTWTAPRDTTVATVRAGYADGYPRALSGRSRVSLRGRRLEVAGRVCMDQLLVDAGDLDVGPGDTVTLWGPPGPDAESLARLAGTISYELLTGVGARVPRVYLG